jgi:hypothetical protein
MDYHAVGSRRGGFDVAVSVSELDRGYLDGIVEWAVLRGTGHWEERGREGCARVLGRLFAGRHEGLGDVLRTLIGNLAGLDVFRVHGSLLAIGEIVRTLTSTDISVEPDFYDVHPSYRGESDGRRFNFVWKSCLPTPKNRSTQISSPSPP